MRCVLPSALFPQAKGSISQKSSEDVKAAPAAEGDWGAPKLDKLANQLAEAMTDAVAYAGEKAGPKDEFKKLRCEYFLSRMRKAEPELKKLLDDKGAQGKGHWLPPRWLASFSCGHTCCNEPNRQT